MTGGSEGDIHGGYDPMADQYSKLYLIQSVEEECRTLGLKGDTLTQAVHEKSESLFQKRFELNQRFWQKEVEREPITVTSYEVKVDERDGLAKLWHPEAEVFLDDMLANARRYAEESNQPHVYNEQEVRAIISLERSIVENRARSGMYPVWYSPRDGESSVRYMAEFSVEEKKVKARYIDVTDGRNDLSQRQAQELLKQYAEELPQQQVVLEDAQQYPLLIVYLREHVSAPVEHVSLPGESELAPHQKPHKHDVREDVPSFHLEKVRQAETCHVESFVRTTNVVDMRYAPNSPCDGQRTVIRHVVKEKTYETVSPYGMLFTTEYLFHRRKFSGGQSEADGDFDNLLTNERNITKQDSYKPFDNVKLVWVDDGNMHKLVRDEMPESVKLDASYTETDGIRYVFSVEHIKILTEVVTTHDHADGPTVLAPALLMIFTEGMIKQHPETAGNHVLVFSQKHKRKVPEDRRNQEIPDRHIDAPGSTKELDTLSTIWQLFIAFSVYNDWLSNSKQSHDKVQSGITRDALVTFRQPGQDQDIRVYMDPLADKTVSKNLTLDSSNLFDVSLNGSFLQWSLTLDAASRIGNKNFWLPELQRELGVRFLPENRMNGKPVAEPQDKHVIRVTHGIIVWFMLGMMDSLSQVRTQSFMREERDIDSKDHEQENVITPDNCYSRPWILLAIIWYLAMVREQGMPQGAGISTSQSQSNSSQTDPCAYSGSTSFSSSGIIYNSYS